MNTTPPVFGSERPEKKPSMIFSLPHRVPMAGSGAADAAMFGPRTGNRPPAKVFFLKERNLRMLKSDLILRNPLRLMGKEDEEILPAGAFGAVLARAGVGKTALLVQVALYALLRSRRVLHLSLNDPVDKVNLWYQEVFRLLAERYDVPQTDTLWDALLPHRFIMTFKVEGFSVPKLEERLNDLMAQNIFTPDVLIIDGFPLDSALPGALAELKQLVQTQGMRAWFTVRTHRHEAPGPDGIPLPVSGFSDLFEVLIQILPEGSEIRLKALKGGVSDESAPDLFLDPSTMLIIDTPQSTT